LSQKERREIFGIFVPQKLEKKRRNQKPFRSSEIVLRSADSDLILPWDMSKWVNKDEKHCVPSYGGPNAEEINKVLNPNDLFQDKL